MSVHKNLTGADLHEPKGADTALSGQVYVSNGVGGGVWTAASSIVTNTAFTTGDTKYTFKTTADTTWVLWVDGTIGDGSSGATIRANADTASLFALFWNNCSNTICPVSSGRGVSAVADYAAHKTITLPLGPGHSIGIAGSGAGLTTRTLGASVGSETATISTTNLPPYTPLGTVVTTGTVAGTGQAVAGSLGGAGAVVFTVISGGSANGWALSFTGSSTFTGTAQGGASTPFSIIQPTTYLNMMIKL